MVFTYTWNKAHDKNSVLLSFFMISSSYSTVKVLIIVKIESKKRFLLIIQNFSPKQAQEWGNFG